MNIANLSISEISNLYKNKELKPSEVYKEVFTNASLSESIIHAHLKLFQDEATEASKLSDERYELNGSSVIREPKSESLEEVLFPNSSKFKFALSTWPLILEIPKLEVSSDSKPDSYLA